MARPNFIPYIDYPAYNDRPGIAATAAVSDAIKTFTETLSGFQDKKDNAFVDSLLAKTIFGGKSPSKDDLTKLSSMGKLEDYFTKLNVSNENEATRANIAQTLLGNQIKQKDLEWYVPKVKSDLASQEAQTRGQEIENQWSAPRFKALIDNANADTGLVTERTRAYPEESRSEVNARNLDSQGQFLSNLTEAGKLKQAAELKQVEADLYPKISELVAKGEPTENIIKYLQEAPNSLIWEVGKNHPVIQKYEAEQKARQELLNAAQGKQLEEQAKADPYGSIGENEPPTISNLIRNGREVGRNFKISLDPQTGSMVPDFNIKDNKKISTVEAAQMLRRTPLAEKLGLTYKDGWFFRGDRKAAVTTNSIKALDEKQQELIEDIAESSQYFTKDMLTVMLNNLGTDLNSVEDVSIVFNNLKGEILDQMVDPKLMDYMKRFPKGSALSR